jgi:cyclohexadieny/prephenate dehydrogenase / 3-phosphoshikimate 1-carboxyvinyltransferase
MTQELIYIARPGTEFRGTLRVPGDKSVSHRSIMFGSIAEGTTRVSGFLQGEDSLNTLRAFRAMGVKITDPDAGGNVVIEGVGMHGLKKPAKPLYMGNSGTSMRLLSGLLSAQSFDTALEGDESLTRRPMKRVIDPLTKMGATIDSINGLPPLKIRGGARLRGIEYAMPMASAQVKSCLLLAGLYAEGDTTVIEPETTRDHTERMLTAFGYPVMKLGPTVRITGGGKLKAGAIQVPADISSAAFFMVGGAIASEGEIVLQQVGTNPTRTGVLDILRLMGADIELGKQQQVGGEPVADIRIRPSKLQGIEIPEQLVPLAIDEFPVLFVAAACAQGKTVLRGAEELRVKESDRIQVMADGLKTLGIKAEPTPDGIVIEGKGGQRGGIFGGGEIDSHGDHRIAMAFSIASLQLKPGNTIKIRDCVNVNTSFPGFVELAAGAGLALKAETAG